MSEGHDVNESVPESGRIDIHSHLLPSVDDGCRDLDESLDCVRRLKSAGFAGSICTPHVYPQQPMYPSVEHVRGWVIQLDQRLKDAGLSYHLWPGAELRLYNGVVDWMRHHGPPTLAGSRCVLVDFWEKKWPKWATEAFEWLLGQGYQPILAHPERLACTDVLDTELGKLTELGVWLQGNFRSMTGEEGFEPSRWVRKLLDEDRYQFLALDMHRPDHLHGRLDGMGLVEAEFGSPTLDRFTIDAPRRHILLNPTL